MSPGTVAEEAEGLATGSVVGTADVRAEGDRRGLCGPGLILPFLVVPFPHPTDPADSLMIPRVRVEDNDGGRRQCWLRLHTRFTQSV